MVDYPHSRRDGTRDILHGRPVADPYRWLEDPDAAETADWVRRQNAVTETYLAGLPERSSSRTSVRRMATAPMCAVPSSRPPDRGAP